MRNIRLKEVFFSFTYFRFCATQINVKNICIFYLPLCNSVAQKIFSGRKILGKHLAQPPAPSKLEYAYCIESRPKNKALIYFHLLYTQHACCWREQCAIFVSTEDFVTALGAKSLYFPHLSLVISNLWSCTNNSQNRIIRAWIIETILNALLRMPGLSRSEKKYEATNILP